MLPEGVAVLMAQPVLQQQRFVLEAHQPHVAPALPHQQGIGRARAVRQHGGGPAAILVQQAAALVVDVIGVAIDRGVDGNHRLQRRRAAHGDLQPVEAAPGDADHADRAAAPRLLHQPVDHLQRVVLLLLEIFVPHKAIGFAVAAHIHAHAGIAVAGHVGMGELIADRGAVALPVGQIFQDGRNRVLVRVGRQPDAGGQMATVFEGDPGVLYLLHLAREFFDRFH